MRSSTLSAPPPSPSPATVTANILDSAYLGLAAHTSFAEVDIPPRKELPGCRLYKYIQACTWIQAYFQISVPSSLFFNYSFSLNFYI